jgi:hypothetical protein
MAGLGAGLRANNAGHPVVATDGFLYFIACRFYTGARNPIDLADSVSVTLEGCRLLRPAGSEAGLCFTDIFGYDNNFFEQAAPRWSRRSTTWTRMSSTNASG